MSAVRKEEKIIPIRPVDPDEPRFTPVSEMFVPPMWGKFEHSEEDLRSMWSRIWRCFKSAEMCKGFMFYHKVHSLEIWAAAFETVRQKKDEEFNVIRYVKRIADRYEIDGTPAMIAEREAREQERLLRMKQRGALRAASNADDPTAKVIDKRNKEVPLEDFASHPMTLQFKNRNRGEK